MLPIKFIETVKGVHGKKGRDWLENFDQLRNYCETRWEFEILDPYTLSYNFVAPAQINNGSKVVVKLGVPSKEILTEVEALRIYDGNGMVRLIDADCDKGIIILEEILPGRPLYSLDNDAEATYVAAEVMNKLFTVTSKNKLFPTTEEWAKGLHRLRIHFNGGTGPLPTDIVVEVEQLYLELHRTISNPILLHGDLHHGNILSTEKNWLAIDPKGVIGEAEYGLIQFLLNELPDECREDIIEQRINIFEKELKLNKKRILQWGLCHSTLSTWWCIEDNTDGVASGIETVKAFKRLLTK